MKQNNTLGIDLAKNIMHFVEVNSSGKKISQKKVNRDDLITSLQTVNKDTLIAMEACSGSNFWARKITEESFKVILVKTKDAKIYAQSKQKNDYNDALAITKAAKDPELKFVKPKSLKEQDISFTHKTRMNTIRDRVQKTNSMISSLHEYGFITKAKKTSFAKTCRTYIEIAYSENYISEEVYKFFLIDCQEIGFLLAKEKIMDKAILEFNKQDKKAQKLQKIIGIGPINASCLSIAPIDNYENPRDFAASLGLVPKQYSSGDKTILGGITKQGDKYARTMLIQGARSIAMRAKKAGVFEDKLTKWARKKFAENKPFNVICVGLANKLARIVHSVIMNNTEYMAI